MKFLLELREADLERKQLASPATSTKENRLSVMGPLRNLFSSPSSAPSTVRDKASLQIVNVNLRDKNGETALHCAAKAGNMDIATLLVDGWIDLTVKSEQVT